MTLATAWFGITYLRTAKQAPAKAPEVGR